MKISTPVILRKKKIAIWECVVTDTDGDDVSCDAHPIGGIADDVEFWVVEVPGHRWTEGDAFYVLRS